MRNRFLLAVLAAVGCTQPATTQRSPAPANPSLSSNRGATSENSFDHAFQAFRDRAAAVLGADPADLNVIPSSEHVVGLDGQGLGQFIAFQASAGGQQVRGWATRHGAAVLGLDEDISLLVQEAELLGQPTVTVKDLAARLAWGMGADRRIASSEADLRGMDPPSALTGPELVRAGDGGATFRFFFTKAEHPGLALFEYRVDVSSHYVARRQITRQY